MSITIKTQDQNGNGAYQHEFDTLAEAMEWIQNAKPYKILAQPTEEPETTDDPENPEFGN